MAWTNLFDIGECTVTVWESSGYSEMFSQVMAKGDTATYLQNDETQTITVDSAGKVFWSGRYLESGGMRIAVVPTYPHDYPARVIDMATDVGNSVIAGINSDMGNQEGTNYQQYGNNDPADPEPMDLTSLTGAREFVGMQIGGIG